MDVTAVPVDHPSNTSPSSPLRPLSVSQQDTSNDEGMNADSKGLTFSHEGSEGPVASEEVSSNVIFGGPDQETNPHPNNRAELVAKPLFENLPKPHRPPGTIWKVNQRVSKGYSKLMADFSKLMATIFGELFAKTVPIQPFIGYLMGLKSSMTLCVLSKDEMKLSDLKDWTALFDALSHIKAWDCLNYKLLEDMLDVCLQDSGGLKNQLEEYGEEVQQFIESTLLLDFLDVYKELFPNESELREGCAMLKTKAQGDLSSMTLYDFQVRLGYVMSQFRIHHYLFRLATANEGCVTLFWYVPQCYVPHIKKVCQELLPDFGQAGIIELYVDDFVLYQARNIMAIKEDDSIEPASDVMLEFDGLYAESIDAPQEFWSRMAAKTLEWKEPFTKDKILSQCNMAEGRIHWFDGKLNTSVNCLDRHAASTPHKVAIIWEKNDGSAEKITYQKLLAMTCQLAHVLKNKGVKKGHVVLIYMSSSPVAVAAMLACTRIGAIHCFAYAVLKSNELESRIKDANASCVITSDVTMIGDRTYMLKKNVDRALSSISLRFKPLSRYGSTKSLDLLSQSERLVPRAIEFQRSLSSGASGSLEDDDDDISGLPIKKPKSRFVVLVSRSGASGEDDIDWNDGQDFDLQKEMAQCPTTFEPEFVEAEHTMFIMYTSGTTAATTPTGIKHCTAGYLLYVALTHQYVFDYKPGDVFGCMADLGWITGHSYVVYGPLCNGATTVLFEGTATYPTHDRYWKAVSRHKINQLYVTPNVMRELMKLSDVGCGSMYRGECDLSSLRTIATVGEPLDKRVLDWILKDSDCRFVDTWWQTELGGVAMIIDHQCEDLPEGNFPATPFFGVDPVIIDPKLKGKISLENMTEPGYLCLSKPLPGMGRGVTELCGKSFEESYFQYKGYGFSTHDLALKLESGGYRVTGRLNNAVRIQGLWLDVASIEDQMNASDDRIVKTALVGIPDKHVSTEKYAYEGVCILLECSSDDKSTREEVHSKVMQTARKMQLPDKTTNDILPGILVLFVSKLISTPSGKILVSLYQNLIDVATQFWFCSSDSSEISYATFCTKYMKHLTHMNQINC